MLKLLTNFLSNGKQRVVLNGQCLSWIIINIGVPQGSILGPSLFPIYMIGLPDSLRWSPKFFAKDTLLLSTIKKAETATPWTQEWFK